jgi:hypothetical protein
MTRMAFALGALSWSASEYAIHRFVGHGPRRTSKPGLRELLSLRGLAAKFNDEHVAHHADPSYFAPTSQKAVGAVVALSLMGTLGSLLVGPRRGLAFGAGFAASYVGYEILHRRIHTHPPRGPHGRWARRNHLLHHHKSPSKNHGVTNPLFDLVFGTHTPVQVVKVPRQSPPAWLTDPETGEVRPEFAADYALTSKNTTDRRTPLRKSTLTR